MSYLYNPSTICEICGKDTDTENEGNSFNKVVITHDFGERWAGSADHNSESFSPCICGKCFKKKIIPFLKSLGVNTEYKDTSNSYYDD